MAQIESFRGARYSLASGKDVSNYLAPPYDTISNDQAKQDLLQRSAYNIVTVDLPVIPAKQAGPEYLYQEAGETLRTWLVQHVLVREIEPAIYLYQQSFQYDTAHYIRRGFIAALRLEEPGKGAVVPHEQTSSGPKEDRFMLTKATQSYLSQVFCLYEDPDNEIADTLYARAESTSTYYGELNGVRNEMWVITERQTRRWLTAQMEKRPVFIADGHHRYATAVMYRDDLAQRVQLHANHCANYVCAMFVSISEPGMLILPTHRAVTGLKPFALDELADRLKDQFNHRWLGNEIRGEELERAVNQIGGQAFAFFNGGLDRALIVWPKDPQRLLDDLADRYNLAWRTLPTAILHHYILDRVVYPKWLAGDAPTLEYFPRAGALVEFVRGREGGLGVVVPPTPVESVRRVCHDGLLMPQKSTYFYPKLATGLVIYPMFD